MSERSHTATLSVSGRGMDCREVVRCLRDLGIASSVTPNTSVQCHEGHCWLEEGCRVVQAFQRKSEVTRTWSALRDRMSLGCAHLRIDGVFSGCVLDYCRPTRCTPPADDTS